MNTPSKNRLTALPKALVVLVVVPWLSFAAGSKVGLNITDSNPYTLFWNTSADGKEIKKGQYVYLTNAGRCPGIPLDALLIKKVGCASGDVLAVEGLRYFCNGQYLGTAKTVSLSGKPLFPLRFNGILPYGRIFVVGYRLRLDAKGKLQDDSCDSRIFGLLPETSIKGLAQPIF